MNQPARLQRSVMHADADLTIADCDVEIDIEAAIRVLARRARRSGRASALDGTIRLKVLAKHPGRI